MNKKFTIFRSQLLFIGLAVDEMMNVETSFNRFNISYNKRLSSIEKLEPYDLICLPEEECLNNQEILADVKVPYLIIGKKVIKGSAGLLERPIFIRDWLEVINKIIEPVKSPVLEKIDPGAIVRSKTIPVFGKGVIVSLVGEKEVMVKFPDNPLLPKDNLIRCLRSELQILGKN